MQCDSRVDILRKGVKIGEVFCTSLLVKFNQNSDVCRAMQADLSEDNMVMSKEYSGIGQAPKSYTFQKFTDRLRPVLIVDGREYFLGTFMAMATPEKLSDTGSMYRLEAYDETMILKQAAFTQRTLVSAGTPYITAIQTLLTACGFTSIITTANAATVTDDIEYAPGVTYLTAVNELLDGINYEHVHVDHAGNVILRPVQQKYTADHVYNDRKNRLIQPPIERTEDIYSLPNVISAVVSLPQNQTPLVSIKENHNAESELSIERRGYRVVKVYKLNNIADQQTLDDYVNARFTEASQVTETVRINTPPEGDHEYGDTVQIDTALVSGLYVEMEWEISFSTTSCSMRHRLERKVFA